MNPYTQSVINNTLPLMQQQNALSQNQAANQANSANAFGGSRQGVQQGVAQAQGALNIGQMAAQLNQANFTQAQQAATGDITRNLQAAQGNQSANQANINSLIAGGGRARLARHGGADEPAPAIPGGEHRWRAAAAAGAEPDQREHEPVQSGAGISRPAARRPAIGARHDALRLDDDGLVDRADAADHDAVAHVRRHGRPAGARQSGLARLAARARADWSAFGSDRHLKTDITKVGVHPPTGLPLYSLQVQGRSEVVTPRSPGRWPRTRCRSRRRRSRLSASMRPPGRRCIRST